MGEDRKMTKTEKSHVPLGTSTLSISLSFSCCSHFHKVFLHLLLEGTILLTFVSVSVGFCSVLAYIGFNGRVTTVGIDLGTTFSVAGLNRYGMLFLAFYICHLPS